MEDSDMVEGPPPVEGPPLNNNGHLYSSSEIDLINSIAEEASDLFPEGKQYTSPSELCKEVRLFAHRKGFAVSTHGTKVCCTRAEQTTSYLNQRAKILASGTIPDEKRRNRPTTRCACPFKITYSYVNRKNKDDKTIKLTKSSYYKHDNGCTPSRSQLVVEKRKAGTYTVAVNETQIKTILTLIQTNRKIPPAMLRDLMRPLFPQGHSLDAQLMFNFRLKCKRILSRMSSLEAGAMSITSNDEMMLLDPSDMDNSLPSYYTEAFQQFNELLIHSLSDNGDLNQIDTYLFSLSSKDASFQYRRATAADGTVTGFVWQTGVMRRDFQLYGSALFVDRLGRQLNNKGWPLMTTAMLCGYKRVCLPSEAIVVSERVDAYAWKIKSTVEMTPGFQLSDIKVIFADGIHAGETLLSNLGIQETCHIVLDHYHLLDEEIGSWPKQFGLVFWANQLKEDCHQLVKTYQEIEYNRRLESIRLKVQHNPDWVAYVDEWIHGKRHMFANHIIQDYHGTLKRQGNAPAEANHSSVFSRLGRDFFESPVKLIESLLRRHADISSERSYMIQKYHFESAAKAYSIQDANERNATLSLGPWGIQLYRSTIRHSEKIVMQERSDGSFDFADKNNNESITLSLPAGAVECSCKFWRAFHFQCSHLFLLHKGFICSLCAPRWMQFRELETTVGYPSVASTNHTGENLDGENNCDFVSNSNNDDDKENENERGETISIIGNSSVKISARDMLEVARDFVFSVDKIREREKRTMLFGALVKLAEFAKGNIESMESLTLEAAVNDHLSVFCRTTNSQPLFSQQTLMSQETTTEEDVTRPLAEMRRGAPFVAGNQLSKKRKKSSNERMMDAQKRKQCCSICLNVGHFATGSKCAIPTKYNAYIVDRKQVPDMAAGLGNPMVYKVDKPNAEKKEEISVWQKDGSSDEIPAATLHIVLMNCYACARANQPFNLNLVEVVLLGIGGQELFEGKKIFYPVYKVQEWLNKNCLRRQRTKHVMSALPKSGPTQLMSQDALYEYSP